MSMATASRSGMLLLVLLAGWSAGCATSLKVELDEDTDFGRYATWGWRLEPTAADEIEAGYRDVGAAVGIEIARTMHERGLVFAKAEPDLLVTPSLRIRRREMLVQTALPDQFLPSLHSSPSYSIEGLTREEVRVVEAVVLDVAVRDADDGRVVWRGRLRGSFGPSRSAELLAAVEGLMAPFPQVRRWPDDVAPPLRFVANPVTGVVSRADPADSAAASH